ncbi:MAG: cation:proton antiporter [Spirochaetaceae bacterium]|jgi:Kef-type K+ transport system membrane component KefB/mannitol/fructose-specific phosphotransferase system IIA component (Ntr-type)|nr:cation:proton antiporter [Spirochaetaceae bacterium]
MTETMTLLVLQVGLILFAVRLGGRLVKLAGVPPVLGELLAGVAIGPYALGSIALPGFPRGIFPPALEASGGAMAVGPELYGLAVIASIILLFASGLETDLALFLRYSLAGGIIGLGGVIFSFALGALTGTVILNVPFADPRCLFLGILSTATSVGITARILRDHKKMDSPEGVTILAAAVFDDVLGIIALAVVLGIVAVLTGHANAEGGLSVYGILAIAGKAFGIWLGFTALGLIFSTPLGKFLKLFKSSFDFSILALGIALILAGIFEKQGLAMIIGAYVAGLSLSKTDIAAVIQEKIRGLYDFFVPIFFAVMGMMVDLRELFSPPVLIFGAVYSLTAILAKVAGGGGPALLLGFKLRGALRIGAGMVPRGEVALIIAGIGLSSGILDKQLFGVIILMTLVTTLAAPPILSAFLRIPGPGTRKPVKDEGNAQGTWDFGSGEIAGLVMDTLQRDLKAEGFYVQIMDIDEGLSQARKDDVALSICQTENIVTIESATQDLPFVKTAVYEAILRLHDSIQRLKKSADPQAMKKEISGLEGRVQEDVLSLIRPELIRLDLRGETKEDVLVEMVDLMAAEGKPINRDETLEAIFQREKTMSTGMEHGIALPHAKTDGTGEIQVAVGIKKTGIDFGSLDGEKSRLFIMIVSPKKTSGPHVQFLAAIGAVLQDPRIRDGVLAAKTTEEAAALLRGTVKPRQPAGPQQPAGPADFF